MTKTILQEKRLKYQPCRPSILENLHSVGLECCRKTGGVASDVMNVFSKTRDLGVLSVQQKPRASDRRLRIGVLFSGGPAPGGHNVIAGLFDGMKQIHSDSQLIGFLDGPQGLIDGRSVVLDRDAIDAVRNQGGFDLIGSGRTKIETDEQLKCVAQSVVHHQLDSLLIIGGDDSNTNAAYLAEYFLQQGISTGVMGCPKTIDGDLQSSDIEISFGFDSATKTYSELIGNIAKDAASVKKYYHFIKLMGRSASHVTLECALATCPNLALIGEEGRSLTQMVNDIVQLIVERKENGKNYGVILLPEGLIEFIPELKELIQELNFYLERGQTVIENLQEHNRILFDSLPIQIQQGLLLARDSHGNTQLSQIETQELLIELVSNELRKKNLKINALSHFFGYEGRSCLPSNFDANYCYSLGLFGALAARDRATGVMLGIKNLRETPSKWIPLAIPIVQMMAFEMRNGQSKPVVRKTLVDLKGRSYLDFMKKRAYWRVNDCYRSPGPIQFFGESELTDSIPLLLALH